MQFHLPALGKAAVSFPYFPTAFQAFIFRAYEYVAASKIAEILNTTEENVRLSAAQMGLPEYNPDSLWLTKGYITIIRRLWHILPYEQLLQLLEMDEQTLAVTLREDDFLDIKLGDKPQCDRVFWRELTDEEKKQTEKIRQVMSTVDVAGVPPFAFRYDIPEMITRGNAVFETRMIYAFSGLYQHAFDVDSRIFCPDSLLEAYSKLGVNAVWTQGVLFQLTEFPFAPSISEGWQKRIERMKDFADRLEKYGMKLFLYLNEPRSMPAEFFDQHPELRGHIFSADKTCLCVSTPQVQEYLTGAIETLCRAVPNIGGFFTITRSENPTNCYSHTEPNNPDAVCTCPRCSQRPLADVICDTIACFRNGADRVDPAIKVMAWSWRWDSHNMDIIAKLPERVILLSQSELDVPFDIGGAKGAVLDYSMSIIGPGERALAEWKAAAERGIKTGAKVQVNTTWEASTVPAIPVYQAIEEHIRGVKEAGVSHLLLSWTLGGYPSRSVAHAAKYFYEYGALTEDPVITQAANVFSQAFREFPFHIDTLYFGPQNPGPSSMLFARPTGYDASMTCFAYDDLEKWRSIYPVDVFERQFALLCDKWEKGLELLQNIPQCETTIMAEAAYCLFKSSLEQIRFYRAREGNDVQTMINCAREEEKTARKMLSLMNADASIGYEAANHYYFSKGQLAEKIVNCRHIMEMLV